MAKSRAIFDETDLEDTLRKPRGNNYLFVIGIDHYVHCPQLANAVRDARDLIAVLTEEYAFRPENVITLFDEEATEDNILYQFRELVRTVTPSDNLLVYYSGHGRYDKFLDQGYWIPVDAHPDMAGQQISNSNIVQILRMIKSHHTFLMVDSCFAGSLFSQFRVSGTDRLEATSSRWGLTAGRNEIVEDGTGTNSPFAQSLLRHLRNNADAISVGDLCRLVVADVASNNDQIPRGEPLRNVGHQGGEYFFRRGGTAPDRIKSPIGQTTDAPAKRRGPRRGKLMHSLPERMALGRDTRCEVRIAFDRITLLQDFPEAEHPMQVRDIRLSERMKVELLDPGLSNENFKIRPITSTEQFVDEDTYTQWIFTVRALRPGRHELLVKVTAQEKRDGKWVPREIVLMEQVEVVTTINAQREIESEPSYKTADYAILLESDDRRQSFVPPPSPELAPHDSIPPPPSPRPPVRPTVAPAPKRRVPLRAIMGVAAVVALGIVALFMIDSGSDGPETANPALPGDELVVDNESPGGGDDPKTDDPAKPGDIAGNDRPAVRPPDRNQAGQNDRPTDDAGTLAMLNQSNDLLKTGERDLAERNYRAALDIASSVIGTLSAPVNQRSDYYNEVRNRAVRLRRQVLQSITEVQLRETERLVEESTQAMYRGQQYEAADSPQKGLAMAKRAVEIMESYNGPTTIQYDQHLGAVRRNLERAKTIQVQEPAFPDRGRITDPRDKTTYSYERHGKLYWMRLNAEIDRFGAKAPEGKPRNALKFGYLYPASALGQVCPQGWRIPTTREYKDLFRSLGGIAAAYRKSQLLEWNFRLAGKYENGQPRDFKQLGYYWADGKTAGRQNYFVFQSQGQTISPSAAFGGELMSCRCVKSVE